MVKSQKDQCESLSWERYILEKGRENVVPFVLPMCYLCVVNLGAGGGVGQNQNKA